MAGERATDRFQKTATHNDDLVSPGTLRYGLWKVPDINTDEYDEHVVIQGEEQRIDLIAYRYYKDVTLWWAIAITNNIANPLTGLSVGDVLRIPRKVAIIEALAS